MKVIGIDPAPASKDNHISILTYEDNKLVEAVYVCLTQPRAILDQIHAVKPHMVVIEMPTDAMRFNPHSEIPQIAQMAVAKRVSQTRAAASEIKGMVNWRYNMACCNPDYIRFSMVGWQNRKKECRGQKADAWIKEALRKQGYGSLLKPKQPWSNESKRDAALAALFGYRLVNEPVLRLETAARADCDVVLLPKAEKVG